MNEVVNARGRLRPLVFIEERDAAGERQRTITPRAAGTDPDPCSPT